MDRFITVTYKFKSVEDATEILDTPEKLVERLKFYESLPVGAIPTNNDIMYRKLLEKIYPIQKSSDINLTKSNPDIKLQS